MKINKLGFLSLLSFLGILGIITDNKQLLGFFGFSVYFRYFFITPDELFIENVQKSASFGFFSGIAATTISISLHLIWPSIITSQIALVSCFVVSILCFSIILVILEFKEMSLQ